MQYFADFNYIGYLSFCNLWRPGNEETEEEAQDENEESECQDQYDL